MKISLYYKKYSVVGITNIFQEEFACSDIYAYTLIKVDNKLFEIIYSIKTENENKIAKYNLFANECSLIELNDKIIYEKDMSIIKKELEEEKIRQEKELLQYN